MEIPKGARHLLIQEFQGSPHVLGERRTRCPAWANPVAAHSVDKSLLFLSTALKNQETDHLFLNAEDELPESRVVIEKGAAWEYTHKDTQQWVQTRGPLKYGVLLLVRQQLKDVPHARLGWSNQTNQCMLLFTRSVPTATPRWQCHTSTSSRTVSGPHWSPTWCRRTLSSTSGRWRSGPTAPSPVEEVWTGGYHHGS